MNLNENSIIEIIEDDVVIPNNLFFFQTFQDFHKCQKNDFIDIIGIVSKVNDVQEVTGKANNFDKREVTIKNEENVEINILFWGQRAREFNIEINAIIIAKGAKVIEYYKTKQLSIVQSTTIIVNDFSIPEMKRLKDHVLKTGNLIDRK